MKSHALADKLLPKIYEDDDPLVISKPAGIDVGETTDDDEFTLIELECLGSCGTAPVMLVDEKLYENVTPQQISQILDKTRS